LYVLINFESSFKPDAANSRSSAKGLIQFIDSTAKKLGYENSQDLIDKNPTIETQISGPVYNYLKQFKPFNSTQSLFMSVFYPKARNSGLHSPFPAHVQKQNPGIKTPYDYIKKAFNKARLTFVSPIIIFIGGVFIYFILKEKR